MARPRLQLVAPLAHRDFRLFWAGSALSISGRQPSMVAMSWLLFDLTGSPLQLGFLGFVRFVPSLILGLAGGVAADRADRRQLLIATALGGAVVFAGLAALTLTGSLSVWHVLAAGFLAASVGAFEGPSRQAIFPHLIDRRHLTDAIALTATINPSVRIVMPLAAGVAIDRLGAGYQGVAAVLFFISGMYLVSSYLFLRVHMPRLQGAVGSGLQNVVEGVRYVRSNHVFWLLILMAYAWAFFGQSYTVLLPVFASAINAESSGFILGSMFSISGVGGIIGALGSGPLRSVPRPGLIIVAMGVLFGATLAVFATTDSYWPTLLLLMVIAMSHEIFGVTALSILHRRVDDEYRGRVMGLWGMQFSVLHSLGNLQIGALALLLSAPGAVTIAGAIVAAFVVIVALADRQIRNLRHEPPPTAGGTPPTHGTTAPPGRERT